MSHTQGKLRVGTPGVDDMVFCENGYAVACCGTAGILKNRGGDQCRANAARLAHCWNQHDELVAQRDALVEACLEAENAMSGPYAHNDDPASPTHDPVMANARKLLRAAIAKAGGGE